MVAILDIQSDLHSLQYLEVASLQAKTIVDVYKIRQKVVADAQAKLDEVKDQIKGYLEERELTSLEIGDHVVKLIQINRETIDTKVAKVVIPKKYLPQILKVSSYSQLRIDRKKEA